MPETAYRGALPGDEINVNLPGEPLHGRLGVITSIGPFAHTVALEGDGGDERVFQPKDMLYADEPATDPAKPYLAELRAFAERCIACTGTDVDPGEPPIVAMLVVLGEVERLRRDAGYEDDEEPTS